MTDKPAICNCGSLHVGSEQKTIKCLYCGETYFDGCCIGSLPGADSSDRASNVCSRCWSFHRNIQREPKNYAWKVQTVLLRTNTRKWYEYLIKNTDFTSLSDVLRFLEYTSSGYSLDVNLDHWGWRWFSDPKDTGSSGMLSIGSKVFKATVSSLGTFGVGLGRTVLESLSRAIINRELSGTRRYYSRMDRLGLKYRAPIGWVDKNTPEETVDAMTSDPLCQE